MTLLPDLLPVPLTRITDEYNVLEVEPGYSGVGETDFSPECYC